MHVRGLNQICSEPYFLETLGKEPQDYKYNSRFFDAALDKFGQILKDAKMAAVAKKNYLAGRKNCLPQSFSFDTIAILTPRSRI
jgi:hypothetical protein